MLNKGLSNRLSKTFHQLGVVRFITIFVLVASVVVTPKSYAQMSPNSKIFINSCLYGTMTGTLLGVGSLAFTDTPKDKLQRVFRGASLGLYAGILLGAYLLYGVKSEEERALEQYTTLPILYPIITERGFEGAAVDLTLLNF